MAEDDLWTVPLEGGTPRRLTAARGALSTPLPSPDGRWVAVANDAEGPAEVHVLPADGGALRRLTWHGEACSVRGWHPDGRIVYTTTIGQPSHKHPWLWAVAPEGGPPERLPYGIASGVAFGPGGAVALCRHQDDPARWKRYRGGRVGQLWLDVDGSGDFELLSLDGNVARPMWVGGRLWFVSDADGTGNLWSCAGDGSDLRRQTDFDGAYVRHPHTDGDTIVFSREGHLLRLDPSSGDPVHIGVRDVTPAGERAERATDAARWLEEADLHPEGHRLAVVTRGRLFTLGTFDGAVRQLGERQGVRYRCARWLPSGFGIAVISDAGGEEALEIRSADDGALQRLDLDVGRVLELEPSPDGTHIAYTNHRQEVGLVTLGNPNRLDVLDRSDFGRIDGLAWSSDGRWLAWSRPEAPMGAAARIRAARVDVAPVQPIDVTDGTQRDGRPSFDPDGRYLYFLSARELDPVYDNVYFDLGFPLGMRPWVAVLRADGPHPFLPEPRPPRKPAGPKRLAKKPPATDIDAAGLPRRLARFPLNEAIYTDIRGLPGGWVLLTRRGARGALRRRWYDPGPPPAHDSLIAWCFESQEAKLVLGSVTSFGLSGDRTTVLMRRGDRLRVFPADPDKAKKSGLSAPSSRTGRRTGWIDLSRIRLTVDPRADWGQIGREAWRLMREHFWRADLAGVDWDATWSRYAPHLDRLATRSDLNDWLWLIQGELGTSHAYAMGGERPRRRLRRVGRLGAELRWDADARAWRVARVHRGEPGAPGRSPLCEVGVDVREGDHVLAIDGRPVNDTVLPGAVLAGRVEAPTLLTVRREGTTREVTVVPVADDRPAIYRDWVRRNRAQVHAATDGRCGYVHVPDMGPRGYAAFHRDFKLESRHAALIVDVRFNGGGHVSQLLLDKLSRRTLGWKVSRYGVPFPYPAYARSGPAVCLTDAMAGSDGDIFSHAWRVLGLGPVIGTRTWGGVVGIWPRQRQIDRGLVTQPEFASWYEGPGFGIENHGVPPDIEIRPTPGDHAAGRDPQLAEGIARVLAALEEAPPASPPVVTPARRRTPGSSLDGDR